MGYSERPPLFLTVAQAWEQISALPRQEVTTIKRLNVPPARSGYQDEKRDRSCSPDRSLPGGAVRVCFACSLAPRKCVHNLNSGARN